MPFLFVLFFFAALARLNITVPLQKMNGGHTLFFKMYPLKRGSLDIPFKPCLPGLVLTTSNVCLFPLSHPKPRAYYKISGPTSGNYDHTKH